MRPANGGHETNETTAKPPPRASPAAFMIAGFLLALVLVAAAGVLVMGPMMGAGGMMGSNAGGDQGAWPWAVVAALLSLAAVAVLFPLRRGMSLRARAATTPPDFAAPASQATSPAEKTVPRATDGGTTATPASELEAVALRLLERDERLLFIEVREKGGAALQKDLGHRDGFSRSKVTRTLDRLEAKGLIARERDGMTNRVRLLTRAGGPPGG